MKKAMIIMITIMGTYRMKYNNLFVRSENNKVIKLIITAGA